MYLPVDRPPSWIQDATVRLSGEPIGHKIAFYQSVPSTMPIAHDIIRSQGQDAAGVVVVADEQTAGRGRLQRRWEARPGLGLLGSYILCADLLPEVAGQLSLLAGLATLNACRRCCPQIQDRLFLKWPNDVIAMQEDGPVKLAGVLAESGMVGEIVTSAVLGIGINVNQRSDQLPLPRDGGLRPSSLALVSHQPAIDRGRLLMALCQSLAELSDPAVRPPAGAIHAQWQDALAGLDKEITVKRAVESFTGRVTGTTLTGALVLRKGDGTQIEVSAGDVRFHWR